LAAPALQGRQRRLRPTWLCWPAVPTWSPLPAP